MHKFNEYLEEARSDDASKVKRNINNRLTGIKKLAQLLPSEVKSEGPIKFPDHGDIKSIVKQADDIEKMAKDLKKQLKQGQ